MQINIKNAGHYTVLELTGRLDVTWAEPFVNAAQEALRAGQHHLRVDASGLDYLSSAGIRALIKVRRELTAVQGSFAVCNPSPFVENTLEMSGLGQLLESGDEVKTVDASSTEQSTGMHVEVLELTADAEIGLRVPGPWIPWEPVQDNDIVQISFPSTVFGLGIGAPGYDAKDARSRFGEFIAVSGCLCWLPADGDDVPDYLVQADRFVPDLYAIQALTAEGSFSNLIRFRPAEKTDSLTLSNLLEKALQASGGNAVAVVCIAEIEGLVGTALSRSPGTMTNDEDPAQFPKVRNWMGFCGERVHSRQSALLISFAAWNPDPALLPFLAPLPSTPNLYTHTHALVMPFRPLQEGLIDLDENVRLFFESVEPVDLLHLIEDDRPVIGLGQSAFIRGACWCAPLVYGKEG